MYSSSPDCLASMSDLIAAIRELICSSFILSVLICSFKTLICPVRSPLSILREAILSLVSVMVLSSDAIRFSRSSYLALSLSESLVACFISPSTISSFLFISSSCSFNDLLSIKNKLTSYFLRLSLYAKYCLASSDCFLSGPTCFSSSLSISVIRSRFAFSFSSFLRAAIFLLLNLVIPAASSKSSRLSSGLTESILST